MSQEFKNLLSIIAEACQSDDINTDNVDEDLEDDCGEEILDDYEDYEELDEDFKYTAEMVVIVAQPQGQSVRYLMECDSLLKFMKSSGVTDIKEAMEQVCDKNNIAFDKTCLLTESKQDMVQFIEEAKTKKRPKVKVNLNAKLRTTANFFQDVKNKGIKVVKKKGQKGSINFSK